MMHAGTARPLLPWPKAKGSARAGLCLTALVLTGCATASTPPPPPTSTVTGSATATGWIAYQGDNGLALIRADGTDEHALFSDPSITGNHPDWSPDGKTLAFEIEQKDDGTDDLWLANADGTHLRRIFDCSRPCQSVQNPAWSPDGTQIAYSWGEFAPADTQDIHVLDVATGHEVKKFTFPPLVGVIDPRWSPDGTEIAYTAQRFRTSADATPVDGAVGLLNVNGKPTNGHPITPWNILGSYPAWSPTGDQIIFQAGDETPFDLKDEGSAGHTSDLWIVRPDGTGLRQLTHQGPTDPRLFGPDWGGGPHPIRVAIYATEGPSLILGMLDPDGSHLQPILDPNTSGTIHGAHPRWVASKP
jgi:TolB protein